MQEPMQRILALVLLAVLAALPAIPPARAQSAGIVAVVNGDVITTFDVEARRRLFAATAGLPMTAEVLDRITPQVRRLLVDERLRLQEVQRRRVLVTDGEIAAAIGRIEQRNNMSPGGLRASLARQGIDIRALYGQLRATIGWSKLVQAELGAQAQVDEELVRERMRALEAATGQPEFLVAEIFIAVDDPRQEAEAERIAADLIDQLRRGAPFSAVAAQFSQAQSAEQGGDLGWIRLGQLEPEVEAVITQMPPGAISTPIRTAGGFSIVTLRARREVGRDMATLLTLRQVVFPFDAPLDPQRPTPQQIRQAETAARIAESARGCDALAQAARAAGGAQIGEPVEIRLETQTPQLRQILGGLGSGRATQPLIAPEGVALMMICGRRVENLAAPNPEAITETILRERVDLLSRQMMRDLRRRAEIDFRA
jgi:peptidyl-prolyl cis-trans isomerase SurA